MTHTGAGTIPAPILRKEQPMNIPNWLINTLLGVFAALSALAGLVALDAWARWVLAT